MDMASLLLAMIYIAFISLGLPDSLLGSAWPVMHIELNASLSSAGVVTMIISASTIVSSLMSDKLTHKLGTGAVVAISVLFTAAAMLGFSFSSRFWMLCVLAVPYGLGAGAIDAALNNYVALHYSSRHMSWLHCCWGIGATISPYIMGACLAGTSGWAGGFRIVSIVQFAITLLMFIALPLWKNKKAVTLSNVDEKQIEPVHLSMLQVLKKRGVLLVFIAFFSYCAVEQTAMLWAGSYFVQKYDIAADQAANYASFIFIGITAGRAISGFISKKLGDKRLIRLGTSIAIIGIILLFLPLKTHVCALVGFIVIGLGCAPIYPSIVHSTPSNFGKKYSQSIIGIQMAFAYLAFTFMPPLFGLIAQYVTISLLPTFLIIFALLMFVLLEINNKLLRRDVVSAEIEDFEYRPDYTAYSEETNTNASQH